MIDDADRTVASRVILTAKKLMVIVATFADYEWLFATWATGTLINQDERFSRKTIVQSSPPLASHSELCRPFLDELASIGSQIGILGIVENGYFDAVMLVVYVWIDVSAESCSGRAVNPEVAVTIIVLPAIV